MRLARILVALAMLVVGSGNSFAQNGCARLSWGTCDPWNEDRNFNGPGVNLMVQLVFGGGATPLLSLANPSQFGFSLSTPSRDGAKADLFVYGPNGRLIAHETGASGQPLRWDQNKGVRSLPGVYFYVLSVGDYTERGKWVVVR